VEAIGELLGLDVGEKRTGIARASSAARLAEPLESLPTSEVFNRLSELKEQYNVDTLVVGLPRSLNGKDTAQTSWVREWVDKLKTKVELPIYFQDEALTSKQALSYKRDIKSRVDEHALAAAVILQDFLDTPEADRSPS
jgi:putative holliday junction resolvase